MTEFTFQPPDGNLFHQQLLKFLSSNNEYEIAEVVRNSKCKIQNSLDFSPYRKNAFLVTMYFTMSTSKYFSYGEVLLEKYKPKLNEYCNKLMPKELGYDVGDIIFTHSLKDDESSGNSLDIEQFTTTFASKEFSDIISTELVEKGKQMAKVYSYLYMVENTLRGFVEKKLIESIGSNYSNSLNAGIRRKIQERKNEESLNKWISVRGNSDMFYLDFKELGSVVTNFWDIFKTYFPSQQWLTTKIDEIGQVRNLIAHNSFVGDREQNLMKTYFETITEQIKKNS